MEWNGDIGGMQVGFYFYHLQNFDILISRVFQGYFTKLEYCKVTNCNSNPKELGYKPNKPNTINLLKSG